MIVKNTPERKMLRGLAKFIEMASHKDPVIEMADDYYVRGLREKDIKYEIMIELCNEPALLKFRNRIRDLEIGFKKVGDRA